MTAPPGTAPPETSHSTPREGRPRIGPVLTAAAAAAAVAAVAVVAVVVGRSDQGPEPVPGGAGSTTPSAGSTAPSVAPGQDEPVPVFYVGTTPQGPRLYRYLEPVRGGEPDHGTGTLVGLLTTTPSDPDYRTMWPLDSIASLQVDTATAILTLRDASLRDRPTGMTGPEAVLGLQQVVHTVQATTGRPVAVQFQVDGEPLDRVLGVPLVAPVAALPELDIMALVSIDAPAEGQVVSDGHLRAHGRASSFEGTVPWRLLDAAGEVVLEWSAQGTMEDHLTPWRADIDVSGLAPGAYTFVASTDDPIGGEGGGPHTDTRSVTIQ